MKRVYEVDRGDLESALYDAFTMASLTTEFLGRAIGFDDLIRGDHPLSDEDRELLAFSVLQTKVAIKRAYNLFVGPIGDER